MRLLQQELQENSWEEKTLLYAKRSLDIATRIAVPCHHQIAISPITDECTTSHKPESNYCTSSTSTAGFTANKSLSITSTKKTWQEKLGRRQAIVELFVNHLNFPQRSLWNGRGGTISKIREIYPDTLQKNNYEHLEPS